MSLPNVAWTLALVSLASMPPGIAYAERPRRHTHAPARPSASTGRAATSAIRPFGTNRPSLRLPRGMVVSQLELLLRPAPRPFTLIELGAREISLRMVLFDADMTVVCPLLPGEPLPAERDRMNLIPPLVTGDLIQQNRQRDQVMQVANPTSGASFAIAIAVFTGASILVAMPPPPLRRVLMGPLHFGPATFEYGGIGLGLRARLRAFGG